jgi:putative peptidoglycan lipid II flippase
LSFVAKVRATVLASAASLLGRVVGALALVVLAGLFGVSPQSDAYFIALTAASLVAGIGSGLLSTALLPRFMAAESTPERDLRELVAAWSAVALATAVVLLALVLGYAAFAEDNLPALTLLAAVPFALASLTQQAFSVFLSARAGLHIAALATTLTPAVTLACAWALHAQLGIFSLLLGHFLGMALETLALFFAVKRRLGATVVVSRKFGRAALSLGMTLLGAHRMALGGLLLTAAAGMLDLVFFPLGGTGVASEFSYGARLSGVLAMLATTSVMASIVPTLVGLAVQGETARLARGLRRSMLVVGGGLLAATLGIMLLAEQITTLLYFRGSFTADDVAEVSAVIRLLVWFLPFSVVGGILARVLNAQGHGSDVARAAAGLFGTKLVSGLVLTPMFGATGIAAAWVLSYSVCLLMLYKKINGVLRHA